MYQRARSSKRANKYALIIRTDRIIIPNRKNDRNVALGMRSDILEHEQLVPARVQAPSDVRLLDIEVIVGFGDGLESDKGISAPKLN